MQALIFSFNAVAPIILMIATGYFIKRTGLVKIETGKALNKLVFRLFLPAMVFLNVYKIENISTFDFGFVAYAVIFIITIFIIFIPIVIIAFRENTKRGVIIQSVFRSNYALIGIPLAVSLFGDEGSIAASVLSAFVIPLYNILAVISLSVFSADKIPSIKHSLVEIAKNPIIQGIAAGFLCLGIRAVFVCANIPLRLSDATWIYKVLEYLSVCATPIALISLGAQFELGAIGRLKKYIIFGVGARTVIVPGLGILIAYLIGRFSGAHFASFVAAFATPVAVSSVPMAQEMGADSSLAGQLVVWTTISSAITIFAFSFILKQIGIF